MIQVLCDKCGKDCDLNAYEVRVSAIHNPSPRHVLSVGDLKITDDNSKIRFCLCQDCYREIGLPNIYMCIDQKAVVWRDVDYEELLKKRGKA